MKKRVYFFSLCIGGIVCIFLLLGSSTASAANCCIKGNICTPISDTMTESACSSSTYGGSVVDCSNQLCTNVGSGSTTPTGTASNTPTGTTAATGNTTFTNPIGFNSVTDLLNAVLNNLMGLIATVAVLFIVIGGIMYVMSGGNSDMITRAKKTWTGAAIGLAIALASPTFLKTIQQILGGSNGTGGSAGNWVANGLTLQQVVTNVLNLLLSIFGILAIIAMVVGGMMYLTAYGDEKRIDTGKNIFTYAIIGIVVALAALVIIQQISSLLGVG